MKNPDRDKSIVENIKLHINRIMITRSTLSGYDEFVNNWEKQNSILFDLLQIGELVHALSNDYVLSHNNIDFIGIKGLRNRVVHGYSTVDVEIVWRIIENDIPKLSTTI